MTLSPVWKSSVLLALLAAAVTPGSATADLMSSAIPALTKDGNPNVQSRAALVIDMDSGKELFARNPDDVREIASTGKVFVAMLVRKRGIQLDGVTEITAVDQAHAKGGAKSKLLVGYRVKNHDLLRAMLIASDNRAATALARAIGLSPDTLLKELNALAKELGLEHTRFVGPSGLKGNTSTAREMARALMAAASDPVLADIMTTPEVIVETVGPRARTIHYRNTNRLVHRPRYEVIGGKTGYTQNAGYCLIVAATISGKNLAIALLGSDGKLTRYGDVGRISSWLDAIRANGK